MSRGENISLSTVQHFHTSPEESQYGGVVGCGSLPSGLRQRQFVFTLEHSSGRVIT